MAVTPRLGKRLVAGFGCFAFLSLVSGGNCLVGMQGVHMYLGYIGYVGRLWRCICMCYIVYEGWILDGYLMDTLGIHTVHTYMKRSHCNHTTLHLYARMTVQYSTNHIPQSARAPKSP